MLYFIHLIYEIYLFIFKPVIFGVRIILMKGDQVLLIKHTYKEGWHLPGGGFKRGETVEQAARREAYEETGAEVKSLELVGIFTNMDDKDSAHNILFASNDFEVTGRPDAEIAEARFFSLDDLPGDLLPGQRRRREAYRSGQKGPGFGEW